MDLPDSITLTAIVCFVHYGDGDHPYPWRTGAVIRCNRIPETDSYRLALPPNVELDSVLSIRPGKFLPMIRFVP
jgi:hypothetical protein